MNLNGVEYYYQYNAQGDVIGLIDNTGAIVASHIYDSMNSNKTNTDNKYKELIMVKNKLLSILMLILLLTGCSPKNVQNGSVTSAYKFPEGAVKAGKGTVLVITPGGDSEKGNVPVLKLPQNTLSTKINANLSNFQSDKDVFIYINKIYDNRAKGADLVQLDITLTGDFLKVGEYTLSVVQFEKNDPAGKAVEYGEAKYRIQ